MKIPLDDGSSRVSGGLQPASRQIKKGTEAALHSSGGIVVFKTSKEPFCFYSEDFDCHQAEPLAPPLSYTEIHSFVNIVSIL